MEFEGDAVTPFDVGTVVVVVVVGGNVVVVVVVGGTVVVVVVVGGTVVVVVVVVAGITADPNHVQLFSDIPVPQ